MAPGEPTPRQSFPFALIVILVVVLLAVVVVMAVMTLPLKPHLPLESSEKRAMRISSEIGFYALERASRLLARVSLLDRDSAKEFHRIVNGQTGWPTEPEIQEGLLFYLTRVAPALEEMRRGLAAEYFLLPDVESSYKYWPRAELSQLAYVLVAQAKWYEENGNYAEAMANYLDAVKLGRVVSSHDPLSCVYEGAAIQDVALKALNRSLDEYDDTELLRDASNTLEKIAKEERPLRDHLEFEIRLMDRTMSGGPDSLSRLDTCGLDPTQSYIVHIPLVGQGLDTLIRRARLLQFNWKIGNYYNQCLEAVDKPYGEVARSYPKAPDDCVGRDVLYWIKATPPVKAAQQVNLAVSRGTLLAIALRLYRIEHGEYPETLDSLVPGYLDALPLDPFTERAFIYMKARDDFRLYSCGRDGDDDGGVPHWYSGDLIIYLPQGEWLALNAAR